MGGGASSKAQAPQAALICSTDAVRTAVDDAPQGRAGQLAACFEKWDVDGNGTISVHELMRVLDSCGVRLEAKDLGGVFAAIDLNQDGVIDYHEFVSWLYPSDALRSKALEEGCPVPIREPASPVRLRSSDRPGKAHQPTRAPLLVLLHSAAQLLNHSASSECDASAIAFVSRGGKAVDPKAHWNSIKDSNNPCWNITRDLGCHSLGPGADANEFLHVEIRDNNTVIGEVRVPLADLIMDNWYDEPLDLTPAAARKAAGKPTPAVRFMVCTEPPQVKKLFFVRHGESAWNKAQREKDVTALLEQVDHPLSKAGIEQCLQLQKKLSVAKAVGQHKLCPSEVQLLDAQIALSSPLSRAIQTALVGLQPLLDHLGSLHLCRNAREKRNAGGRDSSGKAMGEAEIIHRIHTALLDSGVVQESDIDRYLAVPLDSTEAENRWWNDSRESSSAVRERLMEFVTQMRFLREERIIIVGHSHFFRALLQQGMNTSATVTGASKADVLSKKLENCGVMAVTFDFRKGADKPITEVELVFGTQLC